MTNRLDEIRAKLETGQMITHEDAADIFGLTTTGKATMLNYGVSRDDILSRLRAIYPDEETLTDACRAMLDAFYALHPKGLH
jgi:hypothetical protein